MRTKTVGLLVGRWQPFHNGHLEMVNQSASKVDTLYLGIGSIDKTDSKNPFSPMERKQMIINSVPKEVNDKLRIFFIRDFEDDKKWIECLNYMVPEHNVVFSSDSRMTSLYASSGKYVREIKLLQRDLLSGTNMRQMLLDGKDISEHVPKGTRDVLSMKPDKVLMELLQKN